MPEPTATQVNIDSVLDEQGNLDVEVVELRLELLVLADFSHSLLPEPLEFQLLVEIEFAVIEEMDEILHRVDRWVLAQR